MTQHRSPLSPAPAAFPHACEPLEEVGAASPADAAAALGFAADRLAGNDARPVLLATTGLWLRERGQPFGRGMAGLGLDAARLIWVRVRREADALWALEEALKSGAVAGGLASVERPDFVITRRLDFAARAGRATGILLRAGETGDLSAARRRWRIAVQPSAAGVFDAAAPGMARLRAQLVRRRDGPPGAWDLERDDETHRLRVVAGLADHGLDPATGARGESFAA